MKYGGGGVLTSWMASSSVFGLNSKRTMWTSGMVGGFGGL